MVDVNMRLRRGIRNNEKMHIGLSDDTIESMAKIAKKRTMKKTDP
jgi:hypothetical protein